MTDVPTPRPLTREERQALRQRIQTTPAPWASPEESGQIVHQLLDQLDGLYGAGGRKDGRAQRRHVERLKRSGKLAGARLRAQGAVIELLKARLRIAEDRTETAERAAASLMRVAEKSQVSEAKTLEQLTASHARITELEENLGLTQERLAEAVKVGDRGRFSGIEEVTLERIDRDPDGAVLRLVWNGTPRAPRLFPEAAVVEVHDPVAYRAGEPTTPPPADPLLYPPASGVHPALLGDGKDAF